MDKKKKPTTNAAIAAPTDNMNVRSRQQPNTRQVQNFLLLWLDASIDEKKNKDTISTISKLREIINNVHTFTNPEECTKFIDDINEETTIMISSGALGQTTVPVIHDKPQISAIYIFCGNKSRHSEWVKQWPKVKGVFTDIKAICEALEEYVLQCDQNSVAISFVATSSGTTNKNLNQLDPSFMYSCILKEILLTISFEEVHIREFSSFCREMFSENTTELKNIDMLQREYHKHTPVWWYTYESFLYSMLNRALRTMDANIIIKLGFFLCDLHRQITQLHAEQYGKHQHSNLFTVYRGQSLSQTDFGHLVKSKGGLLSFNNFLTTHRDRRIALHFVQSDMKKPDHVGILFVMKIDPSISPIPFIDVSNLSYFQQEQEVLFSMHSVFRIERITQIDENNHLWQVELSLTSDTDPELNHLTKRIREETLPDESGWYRLGELLIKLGQSDAARQLYERQLEQKNDDREKANIYNQLGRIRNHEGEYREALRFYEKSIEIKQKILPPNHPDLAITYSNISSVYEKMSEYSKALSCHEKAVVIRQQSLPPNHPDLAASYSNISLVYANMGDYSKALSFDEKALEIQQKSLPPNHPDLAITYNNIGLVYEKMSEYSKALSYHEKALEIQQKSLLPNHPDFATSYSNIARDNMGMANYSKALSFYERALDIAKCSLPANHPNIQNYKRDIESLKKKL
jgi:tetratricopeptide (TPR) repeat protein